MHNVASSPPLGPPVLANVVIICSLLYVPTLLDHEAPVLRDVLDSPSFRWLLGLGATGGIALQAIILLPAIHQAGLNFRFRFRSVSLRR